MIRFDLTAVTPPNRRDVAIFDLSTYAGDADHYSRLKFEVRGDAHVARANHEVVAAMALFPHGRGGSAAFEYGAYLGETLREELEAHPDVGTEGTAVRRAAEILDRHWRWVGDLPRGGDDGLQNSIDRSGHKLTRYDSAGTKFAVHLNADDVKAVQAAVEVARQRMLATVGGGYKLPSVEARAQFLLDVETVVGS